MCPFHPVDFLEFGEGHVWVEQGELGRGAIFGELAVPVRWVHGWEGAGHWSPVGDAEAVCGIVRNEFWYVRRRG